MNCAKDKIENAFSKRWHKYHIAFSAAKVQTHAITVIFFYFSITCGIATAQDLRFTQYHASDNFLNPAFAGSNGKPGVTLNFRDQWPDMPQSFISYRISLSQPVGFLNSGFGVYMLQDNQGNGVLEDFKLGGQYMYQVRFSKKAALNFGVDVGLVQRRLAWDKLQFFDQIDFIYGFSDAAGIPNPTSEPLPASLEISYLDIGLGTAMIGEKWFLGLSAAHILQPDQGFYTETESKLPLAVTGQAGFISGNEKKAKPMYINPLMVVTVQKNFSQLLIGSYFNKGIFYPGIFFKHNFQGFSDVCFNVGLKKGLLAFSYSYDLSVGPLAGNTGGAHELSFIINWKTRGAKQSNKNRDILKCPSFF